MHSSHPATLTLPLLLSSLSLLSRLCANAIAVPQQTPTNDANLAITSGVSSVGSFYTMITADGAIIPGRDVINPFASNPVCDNYNDPKIRPFHDAGCSGDESPSGQSCLTKSCDAAVAYLCTGMNTTTTPHDNWHVFEQPGEDCWGGVWLPRNVGTYGLDECNMMFLGQLQGQCIDKASSESTDGDERKNGGHVNLLYGPGQKNPTAGAQTQATGQALDASIPSYYLKPRPAN